MLFSGILIVSHHNPRNLHSSFFHDVPLGIGLLIIILGVPVYWLGVCWEKKPKAFQRFMISLTHGAQKLFVCVPEEEEKDE